MSDEHQQEQAVDHNDNERTWFDYLLMLAAIFGFIFTSVGAGMIFRPLGFIVAGLILLAFAIKGASE